MGVLPVQAMATRMHELAEGCRKVYGPLRLCFAFSPNAMDPLAHVFPTRIRLGLVHCRCLSDHAYLMLRDRSVVVCTSAGRIRVVYRVSDQKSGTCVSFSSTHTTEWRISRGPQDIRFDVVSAGRRTRCRGEARGEVGRCCLPKAVRGGLTGADGRGNEKRTEGSFTSAHWHGIPKKDFLGRARNKKVTFRMPLLSSGAGCVDSRGCSRRRSEILGQPLKFESIGRVSLSLLPDSYIIAVGLESYVYIQQPAHPCSSNLRIPR